jgi:hypothetical protein
MSAPPSGRLSLVRQFKKILAEAQSQPTEGPDPCPAGLSERLQTAISNLREPDGALSWALFKSIEKQLLIDHVVMGLDANDALSTTRALYGAFGTQSFKGLENTTAWLEALVAATQFNRTWPDVYGLPLDRMRFLYGRQLHVGECIRRLREAGYTLAFEDGHPSDLRQLRAIEEDLADRLSAQAELHRRALHTELDSRYDSQFERYDFVRRLNGGGLEKSDGAAPIGFLYRVVSSALNGITRGPIQATDSDLARMRETWDLYRAYAGVWDVEQWTIQESMFLDTPEVVREICERVLYEHNFAPRQQRPSITLEVLDLLFTPFERDDLIAKLPFTPKAFQAVARELLTPSSGSGASAFTTDSIAALTGLGRDMAKTILDALSYPAGSRHPRDVSFFDISSGGALYSPLITFANDEYVLLDRYISGPAFYEAAAHAYRQVLGKRFDDLMGKEGLEEAVRTTLRSHGLNVTHGKYCGPNQSECDAVVETPGFVILIEAKKKGLTRRTLAGDPLTTLFDFSESLLAAHAQLAQHELALLKTGKLDFYHGQRVSLDGRSIQRVAITLLDLGSLSDKVIVGNLIEALRGTKLRDDLTLTGHQLKSKVAFEKCTSKLLESFSEIVAAHPNYEIINKFGIRSFSLSQLLELLKDVKNSIQFEANLTVDSHISFGVGDWLAEYHVMKRVSAEGPTRPPE